MNESAIAHMVVAMLLPEIVAAGANLQIRPIRSKFDQTLQKAIPLHWVEGPLQRAGDLVLDGFAAALTHTTEIQAILQALNGGDVAGAEGQLVALVATVEPQLKPILGVA